MGIVNWEIKQWGYNMISDH